MMMPAYRAILAVMDLLLGWLLRLPTELVLLVLAAATSALLTFVRPLVTNQDWLRRCAQDKRRLKQLIRQAKAAADKEAVSRHRAVLAAISGKAIRAELKPLLVAILPVTMLGIWGFERLAYVPLADGDDVVVKAYFRASAIGHVAHMVPADGIVARNGWVQRVAEDRKDAQGRTYGVAEWKLLADTRPQPYELLIRIDGQTVRKELLVDSRRYAAPAEVYEGNVAAVEIVMDKYKPFGVLGGIPYVLPDAWVVAYLLGTVPLVILFRKLGRIR